MLRMSRESAWPSVYDDREIDEIIWSEIESSPSRGDFVCYLVHRLSRARYREEAQARSETMDDDEIAVPIGYPRAVMRIQALAESGNAAAMFHMGKIHALGIGIVQDLVSAKAWYEKAIELGEIRAHCNLGWLYQSGYGVVEDKEKAFHLLSIGADHGVVVARATIGLMLVTGDNRPAEPELGMKMLKEAFDAGYDNAGNHISDLYFAGKYVHKDIDLAHEWLFKVADRGDERTMAILGHYLVTGSHGKKNVEQGIKLLHDAIEKEYVPAYLWIGNIYKNGSGIERDIAKAREWFEKGASAGNPGCTLALTTLLLQTRTRPASGTGSAH